MFHKRRMCGHTHTLARKRCSKMGKYNLLLFADFRQSQNVLQKKKKKTCVYSWHNCMFTRSFFLSLESTFEMYIAHSLTHTLATLTFPFDCLWQIEICVCSGLPTFFSLSVHKTGWFVLFDNAFHWFGVYLFFFSFFFSAVWITSIKWKWKRSMQKPTNTYKKKNREKNMWISIGANSLVMFYKRWRCTHLSIGLCIYYLLLCVYACPCSCACDSSKAIVI